MNNELRDALEILEKEKNVDKNVMLDAVKSALENAYKSYFNKNNKDVPIDLKIIMDYDTCDYNVFLGKEVIPSDEEVISDLTEVKYDIAKKLDENCEIGDIVYVPVINVDLGYILTNTAKGIIIQKLREQEKNSVFLEFKNKEHSILNGNVRKIYKDGVSVNLGNVDGFLPNSNKVKGENYEIDQKLIVYVDNVVDTPKGPKITLTRTCADLVEKLFEKESQELRDNLIEIKSIAREAGIRTKISVISKDKNIDPVGSLLGVNSIRVNSVVEKLNGEKIDIINYDEDISNYIENAISPAKSVAIVVDEDSEAALVIVPDLQLSLAIGREGQNARLAAKLTGYKIDIKSETQAIESGIADELGLEYDKTKYAVKNNDELESNINTDEEQKNENIDIDNE